MAQDLNWTCWIVDFIGQGFHCGTQKCYEKKKKIKLNKKSKINQTPLKLSTCQRLDKRTGKDEPERKSCLDLSSSFRALCSIFTQLSYFLVFTFLCFDPKWHLFSAIDSQTCWFYYSDMIFYSKIRDKKNSWDICFAPSWLPPLPFRLMWIHFQCMLILYLRSKGHVHIWLY